MPKFIRKALVMAKIESPYGTDSVPAGVDAFLVKNLRLTPMNAEFATRDVVRAYFGNSEALPVGVYGMAEFEVELAGSGAAATAPKWGRLMRACAHSETVTAADITGTAQAGGTTRSIKLAAGASAVDNFYNGMWLDTTAGTNSGIPNVVASYNGTSKIASLVKTVAGAYDATSVYAIRTNVQYRPISATMESVSFVCNYDGIQHKLLGARGSVALGLSAKGIPTLKFKLLGLYQAVADVGLVTPDYSAFKVPLVANSTNTPTFWMHDVSPVLQSLDIDVANAVFFRQLIGSESIQITDREATGKAKWEADTVAFKDWWTVAKNGTLDAIALKHGIVAGNIGLFHAPYVQIKPPAYSDDNGVAMFEADLVVTPGAGVGNDEHTITTM